jgi:TonB-linked SusC/RagA family outer membrane protein
MDELTHVNFSARTIAMNTLSMRRLCVVAAMLLGVVAGSAPAQQASVAGRVTDSASHHPLVSAQVYVSGTTLRTLTDQSGRFHFDDVPSGAVTFRAVLIGYRAATRTITVAPGEAATVDLSLSFTPFGLEAVVVTATGAQTEREQGNAIHKVDPADITSKAPVLDMSNLLNGRAPGLLVQDAGGTTGSGTRTRIRGSNSLSLSNEPVIYVDGVRVENGASSISVGVGGQTPSRLNDINPNDLETVQVAGGPSASVLYGTDAANGVIQLQTKQGKAGPTRWEVYAEGGVLNDITTYPANYRGADALDSSCTLISQVASKCTQTRLHIFNPIETFSPFRTGHRQEYGVAASGGTDQTTYYVSGHWNQELGVYQPNENRQVSVLANLHQQASSHLDFLARAGYTSGKLRLPENDNNSLGVLSSGFLGRADTVNQGYGFLTPQQSFSILTFQTIDRFTGSFQANYRPAEWLVVQGVAGIDFTSRFDERTFPTGAIPAAFSGSLNAGQRSANPFQIYNWTGTVDATASFVLTPTVTSTTTVGAQYFKNNFHGVVASRSLGLAAGTGSLAGGVVPFDSETTQPVVTFGKFIEERVGIRDRIFLAGALRNDRNSSFGVKFGDVVYPKLSGSWVISDEPFFPRTSRLNTLRLRAAWGQSGVHPGPLDAVQYYAATPVLVGGLDVPGITVGNIGSQTLKPERTSEIEVGFEADGLNQLLHLDVAYYDKSSRDALVARHLAPSLGTSDTRFENLGEVSNKGIEITATAHVVDRPSLRVNLTATAWGNRNRLVTFNDTTIHAIVFGLGGFSQRFQPGYALGSYFMAPYTYADGNKDGIIDTSEVTLGAAPVFLGQPFPDHGGTLSADVTILRHLRLYALLDGRFGNKLFNSTEQFRCLPPRNNCRALNDKTTPLTDQAAAAANLKGTQAGYIEDGGFTKLREVSITYVAPDEWARKFGATALSFSVAGRNLATWTNYKGVDPELNEAGQNNFTTADFLTQPPVRYFIGRINVTF